MVGREMHLNLLRQISRYAKIKRDPPLPAENPYVGRQCRLTDQTYLIIF